MPTILLWFQRRQVENNCHLPRNSRDASMDEYLVPFAQVEHLSACLEEKKDKLKDEKKNALI
jgi:hypothetical protein